MARVSRGFFSPQSPGQPTACQVPAHSGSTRRYMPCSSFSMTSFPFSSTITGCTPGIGKVAQPGFAGVMPARFDIKVPAVSVCHQVSTIGQFFLPIFSSYQCHASSLMDSPTVAKTFRDKKCYSKRNKNQ